MKLQPLASAFLITVACLLLNATPALAKLNVGKAIDHCASKKISKKVQQYYSGNPGAPLAIPGRVLDIPEVLIATGLPKEQRIGVTTTPKMLKKIWASIDAWGKSTQVRLVFTMGGKHVMDFPGLVPITQEDLDDGWLDIYADNGDGVHGHLWLDPIKSVQAVDMPGQDGVRTRAISFYSQDGTLAMGVYASITTKKYDKAAIKGFKKTWDMLANMPQICR